MSQRYKDLLDQAFPYKEEVTDPQQNPIKKGEVLANDVNFLQVFK
jgi:hypothetical protein